MTDIIFYNIIFITHAGANNARNTGSVHPAPDSHSRDDHRWHHPCLGFRRSGPAEEVPQDAPERRDSAHRAPPDHYGDLHGPHAVGTPQVQAEVASFILFFVPTNHPLR